MFKYQSKTTNLFCTIAGWGVALVLLTYSLSSRQWFDWQAGRKIAYTAEQEHYIVESESPQVDPLPVDREHSVSQLVNLYQMVTVLEKRLELFTSEKGQNFSQQCSSQDAGACKSNCSRPLSRCPYQRLYDLFMSPNLTLSDAQRQTVLSIADSVPEADIIFLSAASSNHYNEMQAMYHNLHTVIFPHISNYQAVLVDIGLSEKQREMTKKRCQCKVVSLPLNKLPAHIRNNRCYAWKPLIVLALMEKARKYLVYTDASIRWKHIDRFRDVLTRTKTRGVQLIRFDVSSRIPVHTLNQTFDYFGWEPCAFDGFPELHAGIGIYARDPLVTQGILEPWARCALEKSCMCPVDPDRVLGCGGPAKYHRCHRFDQSALGMLTAIMFGTDMNKFVYHQKNRNGDKDNALDIKGGDIMPKYFSAS